MLFGETRAFGYSSEDVQMVIEAMAGQGKEPTFCMGDDIPLAALSQKPHMLFDYFKQRFAQVSLTIFLKFILENNFHCSLIKFCYYGAGSLNLIHVITMFYYELSYGLLTMS